MIILENDHIKATIHPKGAELQSLQSKTDNTEYMWSGDAAYWGKYSPILFPIVGGLKNDNYLYENNTYHLPRHGFARDMEFEAIQISQAKALFLLSSNSDTLAKYPFQFRLEVIYELIENKLSCTYLVTNTDEKEMYFSIGAHPAFAVPNTANTNYEDYFLNFNKDILLTRHKLSDGLIGTETAEIVLKDNALPLSPSLFYEDAIVLKNLQSNKIILGSNKHKKQLIFEFENFPFFGIWAAKDAPFVCLEPWCGIADGVAHNQHLIKKDGINELAPKASFERTWSASIVS